MMKTDDTSIEYHRQIYKIALNTLLNQQMQQKKAAYHKQK